MKALFISSLMCLAAFNISASQLSIPKIDGLPYKKARLLILKAGWHLAPKSSNRFANDKIISAYPEVVGCAADRPVCRFAFTSTEKQCLAVFTQGEEIQEFKVSAHKNECELPEILIADSASVVSPNPQAEDKQVCLQEWDKTRATAESLLERNLGFYAVRIAEQCGKLWTTPEQKALAERILTTEKLKKDLVADAEDRKKRKNKGVTIGMSQEEVRRSSWGEPTQVYRTTTVNGVREQWVFGIYPIASNYLYFENGILKAIQHQEK